jgi:cyclophilin family peptidyl-prolyl cis-trans isomerase
MKLNRSTLALWAGSFLALASLAASSAELERVRVTTNLGAFVVEVQRDRAPLTAENFIGYVKQGYYTNTLFHRVIANFLIQGGGVGPDYKGKPTGKSVPNEAGNGLKNLRGTVGLARASGPHSGDVQFYVNVADNADLDPLPTRWGYAVFGRVVEGMEVVDRISVSPTGAAGPFKQDSPLAPVIIQKIELIAGAPAAAPAPAANPPQGTPMPEGTNLEEIAEKTSPPAGGTPASSEPAPPPK